MHPIDLYSEIGDLYSEIGSVLNDNVCPSFLVWQGLDLPIREGFVFSNGRLAYQKTVPDLPVGLLSEYHRKGTDSVRANITS